MNENETDPRAADATGDNGSQERGQSERPPAAPQPGTWQQQSPWQQPGYAQHPGYHQPAYPQYQGYQQQYQQAAQQTAQQPSYAAAWSGGGAQAAPGTTQTQPALEGQPIWAPQGTAEGQTWQAPGAEGQPAWSVPGAEGQPAWMGPLGPGQQPPRSGRGRRVLAAGAAAVLIALTAGGIGAATAMAFDDNGSSPTVKTGNSSVTRVVDRSSLAQIAAAVQDSVVSITTDTGEGSGVILSADGFIVTNNHVVATAQGKDVTVIFANGQKVQATIVGTDPRTDLAVVKATGASGLQAAKFGSSANMQVGDTVLAIGSPLGLEGSVTSGIISAKDRTIQSSSDEGQQQNPFGSQQQQQQTATTMSGLLQTDAPINPGNSGGALVNISGEVIGINSAIATQGQSSGNIGLGFAIPSDKASKVANDLMAGRKVSHPGLGVRVADAENGGALVSSVTANSAAAKAGLQQGDIITKVDGKAIQDSDDLVAAIQAGAVGQKITIDYTRSGSGKQTTATLTETQ